jgi:hypothetical protein
MSSGAGTTEKAWLRPRWLRRVLDPALNRVARPLVYRARDRVEERVFDHDGARRLMALAEGADYAARHMKGAFASPDKDAVLLAGLKLAPSAGLYAEFGVWTGGTINLIAEHVGASTTVHGFDSFEGLPEDWHTFSKEFFDLQGRLPQVRANVTLHPGWFDATLPRFAAEHPDTPVAFLHVDCDLYSSTKTILDALGERLCPGSVIVFDEYFNYPGWREHEFKAFQELVARRSLRYRYVAYNTRRWNTAVQIVE